MDSQNLVTNAQNMPAGARSDMPEGTGKNGPSLADSRQTWRSLLRPGQLPGRMDAGGTRA